MAKLRFYRLTRLSFMGEAWGMCRLIIASKPSRPTNANETSPGMKICDPQIRGS